MTGLKLKFKEDSRACWVRTIFFPSPLFVTEAFRALHRVQVLAGLERPKKMAIAVSRPKICAPSEPRFSSAPQRRPHTLLRTARAAASGRREAQTIPRVGIWLRVMAGPARRPQGMTTCGLKD